MRFETVSTDKMVIDKRYQRELDQNRVKQIVENFNPRMLGTLEVSVRNGKVAVFDGQHRLAALKKLKIDQAPCIAHDDLTPQQEADLFVALQRQRRNVSPLERFRARVFAGDEVACQIKAITEECGFSVGSDGIKGIGTLERIYRRGGEGILGETLTLARVWEGDAKATDAMLLEGLSILIEDYGDRVNDEAIGRLAAVSPTVILRRATGGMPAPGGGGWTARRVIASELRKIAGVRGRPLKREKRPEPDA